jgi:hypothetical protein
MESASQTDRATLSPLLARLRDLLLAQADAVAAADFTRMDELSEDRDVLVTALDAYAAADATAEDRALLDQIGALDQRLLEMTRAGQEQATHDLGEVRRGRIALTEYQRRGQNLIRNLAQLDLQG